MLVARASAVIAGVTVERMRFSQLEMRDDSGIKIASQILYWDLATFQRDAMAEPEFVDLVQSGSVNDELLLFLKKGMAGELGPHSTWRALHLVRISALKAKKQSGDGSEPTLFLGRRPWLRSITRYASVHGVTIVAVDTVHSLRDRILGSVPPEIAHSLQRLRYRILVWRSYVNVNHTHCSKSVTKSVNNPVLAPESSNRSQSLSPRVAVESMVGQFNLDHPERNSELFFWQTSPLPSPDLLIMFQYPNRSLDDQARIELDQHGMTPLLLHPGATALTDVPVFRPRKIPVDTQALKLSGSFNRVESRWLNDELTDYHKLRAYWSELFAEQNIKVFVTHYKNTKAHCAIADALHQVGGLMTIYQRSFESHSSVVTDATADVLFGFSSMTADIERRSDSVFRYHVATGYLGDHRFSLLRDKAKLIRVRLEKHGAKRILAYFDENTNDDQRWSNGHHFTRENYTFILNKVLTHPWLGLVIKSRGPRTLRLRLGRVAGLLERAEATGRCQVIENGAKTDGWYPPALAALASDLAIHERLIATTAGMEAALAGVPTLMLDREGWPESPLYKLGAGRVVFTTWEELWQRCQDHWATPEGVPGIGDWSPLLDEFDPFRDGRAAERMGTYLHWLMEGFRAGLDGKTVMADAAERYCKIWGWDKVTEAAT